MTYERDGGIFSHFTSMADANARQSRRLAAKLRPLLKWVPQDLPSIFLLYGFLLYDIPQ